MQVWFFARALLPFRAVPLGFAFALPVRVRLALASALFLPLVSYILHRPAVSALRLIKLMLFRSSNYKMADARMHGDREYANFESAAIGSLSQCSLSSLFIFGIVE